MVRKGLHPVIILSGCQRKHPTPIYHLPPDETKELRLCVKLGVREDSRCPFLYPSLREEFHERVIRGNPSKVTIAGVEGLLFVDVLHPERNQRILKAILSNIVTTFGVTEYQVEVIDDIAGFSWGMVDALPSIREGMVIGMINRPGGLAPVRALYRILNGAHDYFSRRGIDPELIEKLAEESLERATKILKFHGVYPINLTRIGILNLREALNLGYSMDLEIPSPWYGELVEAITPLVQDPMQSELLFLVIGEKGEVEDSLKEAERVGFPTFLVGKVLEKGDVIRIKKKQD
ncbi:hypothetical protein L3N51_01562 [Metallosphaera sp. J1]|nr:hypothetical protein [Metallosphaera javensis (ex Hofmann et al. 2022)]